MMLLVELRSRSIALNRSASARKPECGQLT